MIPERDFKLQVLRPAMARGCRLVLRHLPAVVLVTCLTWVLACSSLSASSPDSWTGSYFQNPDRVWAAILETLIDLNYRVAESNRPDGTIQTEPRTDEDHHGVVLSINQVMHTTDQVKVFVKPSSSDYGSGPDRDALKAAADQFMIALNEKLHG